MAKTKKESRAASFFSIELFAMAFALLCTLSLVCMFSGDALFGDLGLIVQGFYLGGVGYVAFPLLFGGLYLGIKGVIGFKVKNGAIKAVVAYAFIYAFFILTIVQTATTDLSVGGTMEYVTACYQRGVSISTAAVGGALFGFVVYPLSSLISQVGVYIACSVILAFVTAFLFRTPIIAMFKRGAEAKKRDNTIEDDTADSNKKSAKTVKTKKEEKAEDNAEVLGEAQTGGEETSSRSDFGGGSEFRLKKSTGKKDSEREYSLKLLFSDDSSNKGFSSYGEAFDEELAAKTEYIRRPYDRKGIKIGDSTATSVEVPFTRNDTLDMDLSTPDSDVFVIRNDRKGGGEQISSFEEARGRNGASAESGYNTDRFVRPERTAYDGYDDGYDERSEGRYERLRERIQGEGGFAIGHDSAAGREEVQGRGRTAGYSETASGGDSTVEAERKEGEFSGRRASGYRDNVTDGQVAAKSFDTVDSEFDEEEETPNASVLRKLYERKSGGRRKFDDEADISDRSSGERKIDSSVYYSDDDGIESAERLRKSGNGEEGTTSGRSEYSGATDRTRGTMSAREFDSSRRTTTEEGEGFTKREDGRAESDTRKSSGVVPGGKQTTMEGIEKDNPIEHIPKSFRFSFPPLTLLKDYKPDAAMQAKITKEQSARMDSILQILNRPNIDAQIVGVKVGPSLTRFEITIPTRIPMRKVMEKADDLNLWMAAKSRIRIIAPIPGTSKIGLEVPNSVLTTVGLKETMSSNEFKNAKKSSLTFALGKDMVGNTMVCDIAKMPHLLVAGATGTGKSVFLNTLLISLMYKYSPEDLRLVLVDPKLVEFSVYRGIPELLFGEIFTDLKETVAMLDWMVAEMDRRYMIFREAMVRDINEYNDYIVEKKGKKMFKILIIIDEFAELMLQGDKKHLDCAIGRLAAKARSAGIHMILATQRPTTNIVDGSIKTNFSSRIAFKMSTPIDAVVIMGEAGAEKLLGDGDMFYKVGKMTDIDRAQGAFIDGKEVSAVCDYVREHNKNYFDEVALEEIHKLKEESQAEESEAGVTEGEDGEPIPRTSGNVDEYYLKESMRIAIGEGNVSISKLQRKLGVGYPKAGKIVDTLEKKGYISATFDNNKRKILMTPEQFKQIFGEDL